MSIAQAPNGVTVVVETRERVFFGRLAAGNGSIALKRAAVATLAPGEHRERAIRRAARFGFPADHEILQLEPSAITALRRLGEIPKE
jgi:hypothetical protein